MIKVNDLRCCAWNCVCTERESDDELAKEAIEENG